MQQHIDYIKTELTNFGELNAIQEKLFEYAVDSGYDAGTFDEVKKELVTRLEQVNCSVGSSPAPIFNDKIAQEIGMYWEEINEALEEYYDATGEYWAPKDNNVLTYLWFAYEWFASELASRIECIELEK